MAVITDSRKTAIVGGVVTIAQAGAAAAALTGTTTETTLATVTIPGGVMGPNGCIRILMETTGTNNANVKTLKVKLGATTFYNFGNNGFTAWSPEARIRNRGAVNSQFAPGATATGFGVTTGGISTGAVDTSVDQTLTITGTLALGTDTLTLEGYTIQVAN